MAAATVGGGIFNTFAFAGASWIFSQVDKSGYADEMKRHDKAEEALERDQNLWYQRDTELKEKLEKLEKEKEEADDDLVAGDKALDEYYKLTHQRQDLHMIKPKLEDYYKPSDKFKKYLSAFKISCIAGVVVIGSRYVF